MAAAEKIKWARPLRTAPTIVEHSSKDGRAKILKDDGEQPTVFRVFIDGEHWADGRGPATAGLREGWWLLRDVKAAVAEHLAETPPQYTERDLLDAMRDPENAPDELLEVVAPNRYIQRRLADPDGKYVIMAERDLRRIRDLSRELGMYDKFKALDIEVVPYEMDLESGE